MCCENTYTMSNLVNYKRFLKLEYDIEFERKYVIGKILSLISPLNKNGNILP